MRLTPHPSTTEKVDTAIEQLTELLAGLQRIFGPDHPDTFGTRNNLAFFLGEAGRVAEPIEQLTRLIADEERILGRPSRHPRCPQRPRVLFGA